jgi:hypothetical protein
MEILLYMVIVTVMLFTIMNFALQVLTVNTQSVNIQEIQTNIDYIGNKISSSTQTASSIDNGNSIFDNDTGKLSLNMADAGKSPTMIYLESSAVYLKEGSSSATKISSDSMKCTQLKFIKITQTKIPDMVTFDMQCEPLRSDLAGTGQILKIHSSVSLRK